jgi:SAM-dependent methyltransferase
MQLTSQGIVRFFQFLQQIESKAYPESPMDAHTEITQVALERLGMFIEISACMRVLDVGCGQGPALRHFREKGAQVVGVTLNSTDLEICRSQGFQVHAMDQSFMDFEDKSFELVWARHVVEHSIMPLYTLHEFRRLLVNTGTLYLEVPGADTDAAHAWNENHYSVFTKQSWLALLDKAGFECFDGREYSMPLKYGGNDKYLGFYCRMKG